MSTSPTLSLSEPGNVFERLAACRGFLTARDVAKMLAISEKTVYSYVSRNMIPHYKIEANTVFIVDVPIQKKYFGLFGGTFRNRSKNVRP